MKILGIGESVIDRVYASEVELELSDLPNMEYTTHAGGPVLASLILLSRLGADCTFITTIGKDKEAKFILELLENEGIKVIPNFEEKTKENSILVNTKNGFRKKLRGSTKHSDIEEIDPQFLIQFDGIILDRHERKAFYDILDKKKQSTKLFIDPSTEVSDFTLDMIRFADFPIIPVEMLKKINKKTDIKTEIKMLYSTCLKPIVVTMGEMGCIIYDGQKIETIPAIKIQALDTNGAGDIFRGGFVYGILSGWNLRDSAQFANFAAGLQCEKLGNSSAIPTISKIMSIKDLAILTALKQSVNVIQLERL